MRRPGGAILGFNVNKHADSGRGQRGSIAIEVAIALGVGGELGIDARTTQQVECRLRLWEEFIPQVEGEMLVHTAEASNKVVFERANCTFSGVAPMDTWRHELVVDLFGAEERFKRSGAFVVETLQERSQAGSDEPCVEDGEGLEDTGAGATFHWLHKNTVTVVIIHDKDIVVAGTGRNNEAPRLVGMDLPGGGIADSSKQ